MVLKITRRSLVSQTPVIAMNKVTIGEQMKHEPAPVITHRRWGWLVLFTSSATLLCCALPIVLVMLGLGAVSASLFSSLPFLVTLANYKLLIFLASAVLLGLSGWALFRANRVCPTGPELARQCNKVHRFNKTVWALSILIWLIGFVAAYLALPIMSILEN